jgi:adenylate cyclase
MRGRFSSEVHLQARTQVQLGNEEIHPPSEKLASRFFFPKVIAMMKAFPTLPPGWIRARLYHLLAPLVALALMAMVQISPVAWVATLLEDQTVNLRFRARAAFDPPADPRLVFLAVDEFSLSYLGRWPWPRTTEAKALDAMIAADDVPHTISFDIMFTENSAKPDTGKPGDDPDVTLGNSISQFGSVITGAQSLYVKDLEGDVDVLAAKKRTGDALASLGPTQPLTQLHGDFSKLGTDMANFPVPAIRNQSLFGFVNDDPGVDGIRHTVPLVVRVKDKVFPSLALQTLCQMLGVDADKVDVDLPGRFIKLTNLSGKTWTIPIDERASYAINYRRKDSFLAVSFGGLMQNLFYYLKDRDDPNVPDKKKSQIDPKCDVRNKTVFIGENAFALADLGPSPLDSRSPLPFVHLNVINNVLKGDYLTFVPLLWVVVGWSLVTWPTLLRLKVAPLVESVAAPIVAVFLYTGIAFGIFWLWSIQIALAWPVLSYAAVNFGGVVLRWREEQKGRQQIKQVFSQMLSPEVMDHLLDHPENVKMGGSKRAVTILFSDIRDYTKFSEGLEEQELVRQLNVYFERMVNCISECRGTLHKFIGDAIMSVWGDIESGTLGGEKDAQNAVRSALMMRHRLRELNDERRGLNLTVIRIGIGLNHGDVLVGLIGAPSRSEFTVMGDAVNTASRLEGITKEFHTDLAISESVKLLIGDSFLVRRLGFIQLKGKTQATLVYEVLAEKSSLDDVKMSPEGVARYETAFDHFLARRFAEAEAAFVAFQQEYPDDFCTKNYLEASREFSAAPPPPEWDGRIVMTTK